MPVAAGVELQPVSHSGNRAHPAAALAVHLNISEETSGAKRLDKAHRGELLQMFREGRQHVHLPPARVRVLQFVVGAPWLAVQATAIIMDMVIMILTWECGYGQGPLSTAEDPNCQEALSGGTFYSIMVLTTVLYVIDIALRIYGLTPSVFFWSYSNCFDFVVVVVSGFGSLDPDVGNRLGFSSALRLTRFVKLIRLSRSAALLKATAAFMRRITGENRRRFVSPEHDLDLNLVYVTPWLIGMSVPASGCMSRFYRNPLPEVVRFFETFHPSKYFMCNLCPEMPYPVADFKTGRVRCFDIQDHTPPLFSETISFLHEAQRFLEGDEERVVAVHCKGGKGRTGSFCCALLLYTEEAEDAEDALNYFTLMRTDTDQSGTAKTQGVETPSQVRYVEYIDQHLRTLNTYAPNSLDPPEPVRLLLSKLEVVNAWQGPIPDDLVVAVHDQAQQFVVHWSRGEGGIWRLPGVIVCGDTRISVFGRGDDPVGTDVLEVRRGEAEASQANRDRRMLAGEEPGCLFYFIFHTSFVEGKDLQLPMQMVDKAAKKKHGRVLYDLSGFIKLSFSVLQV